jgi:S1-C subfamily serine protease
MSAAEAGIHGVAAGVMRYSKRMNWLDLAIVLLALAALARGLDMGLVRQLGSSIGFFGGLFAGAALGGYFLKDSTMTTTTRVVLSLLMTFGVAAFLSSLGEYGGMSIKRRIQQHKIDKLDRVLGAALGSVTLLVAAWLGASFLGSLPSPFVQKQVKTSAVVAALNKALPTAPSVVSKFGHIIEPNGFPNVFTGLEPRVNTNTPLPSIGELDSAVQQDRASVVKIEGRGCGGIVDGSGFVAGHDLIATNAHVVAGVANPKVIDGNGEHRATVVWFDPDLDLAVLRTSALAGKPLTLKAQTVANGSSAAVLGYPGGGDFTADPAAIMDSFTAVGRNIYNQGETKRDVYSVKADVVPGNSGGPLVAEDGAVIGVIFAQSTSYDKVGYALTMAKVIQEINQASPRTQAVATGTCAE